MPASLTGKTMPWATRNPLAKQQMTADTYIERGKLTAVSFDDDVVFTVKDGIGNEDSVNLGAFPVWEGLDSSITHLKVDINTTLHGMLGL